LWEGLRGVKTYKERGPEKGGGLYRREGKKAGKTHSVHGGRDVA
jgi:hypothetical protein